MDPDQMAWDIFFANLVGIQYHPANPPETRMSLDELADIVDRMMEIRVIRFIDRR